MATTSQLYNKLPNIIEAHKQFTDRKRILIQLAPLFSKYNKQFGLSLVHRHCKLEEGEKMVADGPISQPTVDVQCYPERWLATGEPYEFNRRPTISPPQGLLEDFRNITGDNEVLGLCYILEEDQVDGVQVERTEGRVNITEVAEKGSAGQIPTCWVLGNDMEMKELYVCVGGPNGHQITCDRSDTESESD